MDYEKILKETVGYYGKTRAAYRFAAEEYARQQTYSLKAEVEENKKIIDHYNDTVLYLQSQLAKAEEDKKALEVQAAKEAERVAAMDDLAKIQYASDFAQEEILKRI